MRACPGFLRAWVLAAALIVPGCGGEPPPNLLLISLDTVRADHLGAYGYARDTSPNLDALASEGVLFENAIADSSWTLPSHASLFTGQPSRVHGVTHDRVRLAPARVTLAELLASAGYRTEAFVSAPYVHPVFGLAQGFERYEVLGDTVYDEEGFRLAETPLGPAWRRRKHRHDLASHRTRFGDDLAALAVDALDRFGREPFFLFVHVFDAHYDYDPPESYWRLFDPDYTGDFDPTGFATNPDVVPDMPPRELRHVIARYDGEIRFVDHHIGRILSALDARNLTERTLVVVVGDHGEEFFEHGRIGHRRTLFDEQLHVPWIMRLPGRLPEGRRIASQVRLIDVLPTALDVLGLPPKADTLGRSLLPVVEGRAEPRDLPAVARLRWPGAFELTALRTGEGKLLRLEPAKDGAQPRFRYYDLAADPEEAEPVLRGRAIREAVRELRRLRERSDRLRAGRDEAGDTEVEIGGRMREALEQLGYVWSEDQAETALDPREDP